MPSIHHWILAAAQAVLLSALCSFPQALASPVSMPLPLVKTGRSYDVASAYSRKAMRVKHAASLNHTENSNVPATPRDMSFDSILSVRLFGRQDNITTDILNNINILNNYYHGAQTNADNLRTLAAQSQSSGSNNEEIQQQAANEMNGYRTNLLGFQTVLAQLGSDKGLANYDRTDSLETLLKNMVNLNKDLLSSTTVLIYQIPGVGPVLGPIVYQIKCLLDELLDAIENLTDGTLNAVLPLLRPIIDETVTVTCESGLELAGLCV